MSIKQLLSERVAAAMALCGIPAACPPAVSVSKQASFGDFQANGVMGAAKRLQTQPRQLAERVVAALKLNGIAKQTEVAGPGFINIFLADEFLAQVATTQARDERLGVTTAQVPERIVVDYSSPNLAKEMHVGHLRSTIIGDAVARVLEFCGHTVIRQNHLGDWGTQFGMLIAELEAGGAGDELQLADLEVFYQQAKAHFDTDAAFAEKARQYVVRLQSGDEHCLSLWRRFIDISVQHSEAIYRLLGVSLRPEHIYPESAYNDALPTVVAELQTQQLLQNDAGAKVAFLDELADKNGKPGAVIVQKSDGGYLYATTDLAAVRYRAQTLAADRILYFVDARQSLHFKQVFCLAQQAGFVKAATRLQHHAFGTMMGSDGKPFKTRTGGTVKLAALLQEAIERAGQLLARRETDLSTEAQAKIARAVGIGAVKYADLSKTRSNDYIFDWDAMLKFEGNTAPYLQYAYTRIRSVFRKAGDVDLTAPVRVNDAAERQLVKQLDNFPAVLQQMAAEAYPHILCNYLYEIASAYMSFYEQCPVLKKGVADDVKASRLVLCDLTARVIKQGLEVLGIEVLERM